MKILTLVQKGKYKVIVLNVKQFCAYYLYILKCKIFIPSTVVKIFMGIVTVKVKHFEKLQKFEIYCSIVI